MIKNNLFKLSVVLFSVFIISGCSRNKSEDFFQGVTIAPSYSYYMSGRTDRVKGYVVRVNGAEKLENPGLVFLASGIDYQGEAYVIVNRTRYEIPPVSGTVSKINSASGSHGKAQFYSVSTEDDITGKIVIPLKKNTVQDGINEVAFFKDESSDGFTVLDARIEAVKAESSYVAGQTYHLLARGRPASIRDFDFVYNYKNSHKWTEKDIPEWAQRGKVNFYRAGIDYDNLDRMFEMFREAHINLVAVGIPRDKNSKDYERVESFIKRCHKNNIRITAFNSLGGVSLRNLLMNPKLETWIGHDEYGNKLWRQPGKVFAADLANQKYCNYELKYAGLQIDTGVDELYYDYALGSTGDVLRFFKNVRKIAEVKGRNVTIYGNCKGNVLVDEVCDLTKSEGTTEAGVRNGKWVHNIPQARFYYAVGEGIKPYRSKYEGADPGVPNPGAFNVQDGMKCGWQKPIAEAAAFQSHFAIAEAGDKLLSGWVTKDNPLAMRIWDEISKYYAFLYENRSLYTDVKCVSKIGILAPPRVPSFEVSLARESLYNALSEMNIMYAIVLLHRMDSNVLAKYKAIIIPNLPWITKEQLKVIEDYKKNGGNIYTIGSSNELRSLADISSDSQIFGKLHKTSKREKLRRKLEKLGGKPLISIKGVNYVAANIVRKRGKDQYIVHFVNYNKPLKNVKVRINLNGLSKKLHKNGIRLLSPDVVPGELKSVSIKNNSLEFILPVLKIYDVVSINYIGFQRKEM
ncbi:hypothetical protein J7K93_10670 [bacterium]|nr:hypothetical protein [bacterium]